MVSEVIGLRSLVCDPGSGPTSLCSAPVETGSMIVTRFDFSFPTISDQFLDRDPEDRTRVFGNLWPAGRRAALLRRP